MAGHKVVTGSAAEVWRELAEGRVKRVLRIGAAAAHDPTWVAAGSPAKDAVVWVEGPLAHQGVADLAQRVGLSLGRTDAARWESGPVTVSAPDLLGALLQLRPTMKVVIQRAGAWVGLCLANGRIVAAAVEGKRFFRDLAIAGDPALRLPLQLWARPLAELDDRSALFADLAFICEYDALFARSEAFSHHVARVLGEVLADGCEAIHIEGHAPSDYGVALPGALVEAVTALAPEARRALIGDLPLRAASSIPEVLRAAIPPSRFGRLFFALEDGAMLAELPAGRLTPVEVESAVLVGLLAGSVRRITPPRSPSSPPTPSPFLRPRATGRDRRPPALLADPPTAPLADRAPPPPTGSQARVRTGTMPLGTPVDPPSVSLSDPRCGSPRRFLEVLRTVAEEGERRQRRPRVAGTRFAPAGIVAADLLLYFTIGSGGHGSVLVGTTDKGPLAGRVFAAKRLGAQHLANAETRAGFQREARLMLAMRHPHVVEGYGEVETAGGPFFTMELVHGVSLAELITAANRAQRPIPDAVTRHIGVAVADALEYVHTLRDPLGQALGIVHRDVAPANVLLGFDGRVKLTDFSVAQATRADIAPSARTARSGRLGYMAPESLLAPPGPTADVFGLACCLYEVATGQAALERHDPGASIEALVQATHAPVLSRAPALDPRLAYAIERGLAPKPGDRFHSAAALRHAIEPRGHREDAASAAVLVKLLDELFGELRSHESEAIARMLRIGGARGAA